MAPRRSHTKSRNGCVQCKQRRIKCDEQRPTCSNCIKHNIQCTYAVRSESLPKPSTPRALKTDSPEQQTYCVREHDPLTNACQARECATPGCRNTIVREVSHACHYRPPFPDIGHGKELPPLSMSDLELMHQFSTDTYKSFRESTSLQSIWKFSVPQLSLRFPYVMRTVLAVTALHLAYLRPAYRHDYQMLASSHQMEALKMFRCEYENGRKPDSEGAFCFAILVVVYAFGSPKNPGSLGLTEPGSGASEWVDLLRGVYLFLHESNNWLHDSSLRGLIAPARPPPPEIPIPTNDSEVNAHLEALYRLCPTQPPHLARDRSHPDTPSSLSSPSAPEVQDTLTSSIMELQKAYYLVLQLRPDECRIDSVFRWPLCVPQSYVTLLTERDPAALVVLAHFVVLLNKLDVWWIEGWPEHMLSSIENLLSPEWRLWIQWPVSKIRKPGISALTPA